MREHAGYENACSPARPVMTHASRRGFGPPSRAGTLRGDGINVPPLHGTTLAPSLAILLPSSVASESSSSLGVLGPTTATMPFAFAFGRSLQVSSAAQTQATRMQARRRERRASILL